jgi:hypothetical protein
VIPQEQEPGLPPSRESLERGFEPDDAIGPDGKTVAERAAEPFIEPPAWVDELDLAAVFLRPAPPEMWAEREDPEAEIG